MKAERAEIKGEPALGLRSAFYALRPGGWRDYLTLLHPPYTAWHLSYVVLGAALAPEVHLDRLGATLLAFLLAMGVSAHALDELSGRPLRTRIPDGALWTLAVGGLAAAVLLGLLGAFLVTPTLLVFIAVGLFIAPAYNLEWFSGRFHSDFWFAAAWGSFPFLTAYWVCGQELTLAAPAGALTVFAMSFAQRTLSTRVRTVRRRASTVSGVIVYQKGDSEPINKQSLIAVEERALAWMALATVTVSLAALLARL